MDLLRIFDKHKWIRPRIRYASVRSKPELIADLEANPAIESLESLRLSRGKRSGSLDVATTAQAWVYAKGGRR